jgi:dynein heavy chain
MLHNINCIWIENLNTVLDDNKTLVLSNGEKIKMSPNLRIILIENNECENLSPANVSRCGN